MFLNTFQESKGREQPNDRDIDVHVYVAIIGEQTSAESGAPPLLSTGPLSLAHSTLAVN